ncbi:MAG TPA: aldehyde dehydrogenase family protein [bacterium]|nr:aldehyde dehydrogenase family protein [bacterium]
MAHEPAFPSGPFLNPEYGRAENPVRDERYQVIGEAMNRFQKGMLISINPSTGESLGEVAVTSPDQVRKAVSSAAAAFPAWKGSALTERARILGRARQILLDRREEIARIITLEMGRPMAESLGLEVHAAVDLMGYYQARAQRFLKDRPVSLHHLLFKRRQSWLHFEPLGVLGIIAPWNWPLLIPMGGIVPALLAGNAVVFKHSEYTPLISERIRTLFMEAGVPESIFQIVQGGADTGRALVDADVQKIFFTGSTETGHQILKQAADGLKKCVLEMGGSDPAIVCEDADLDYASSGLVWGGFSNCGQNCNGVERILVHRNVSSRFMDLFLEKMKVLRVGNGLEDIDIGPLATESQLEKMDRLMRVCKQRGGEVLAGGGSIGGAGFYFKPTVVRWESHDQIPREEVFGPLVHVVAFEDDRQASAWANDSPFGLASSVWSKSRVHARRLAEQIQAGTVMINDVIVSFGMPEAGWTGIKQSGIGWVHGEKGLDEMVNIKFISRDCQDHLQKYWWFPYAPSRVKTFTVALEFLFSRRIMKRAAAMIPVAFQFAPYLLRNRRRKDRL